MPKQPDLAWQNNTSVTINIERLKIPRRQKGDSRVTSENGKLIKQFFAILLQRGILDSTTTPVVNYDGTHLQFIVTKTPGVGPQVHQLNVRRIYESVMGVPLQFQANSSPSSSRTRTSTGGSYSGDVTISIDIEPWA